MLLRHTLDAVVKWDDAIQYLDLGIVYSIVDASLKKIISIPGSFY
jgi:hypothetical protein